MNHLHYQKIPEALNLYFGYIMDRKSDVPQQFELLSGSKLRSYFDIKVI